MKESIPLAEGSVLGGCVIRGMIERHKSGYTYLAAEGAGQVLVREFLPHDFAWRDNGTVQAREPEDRNALRWWMRSFLDQAAALQKISGPGLERILRAFEANGTAYRVCEHIGGEPLAAILERQGSLAEAQLRRMLSPLLAGLGRAHAAGFLHRDIRPQTIQIGANDRAVLTSFSALRAPVRFKAQTVFSAAEPPYAAPEELSVTAASGPWTDIYALGAVLYEAVAGIKPADARARAAGTELSPAAQMTQQRCSEEFLAAIDAALALPAARRPQSLAVWLGMAQPQSGSAPPSAAAPEMRPTQRKSPALLLLAVVAMVAVAGGAWFLTQRTTLGTGALPAQAPEAAVPASAEPASQAAPSAPAPSAGSGGGLDAMMVELIAKEKKLDDLRNQQLTLQSQRQQPPAQALKPTPAEIHAGTPPPAAPASAPAPSQAELDAEARAKQLEAEIAKLKADKEAAEKADDGAGKMQGAEQAPPSPAQLQAQAQAQAKAEQDREAKIIAKAKASCRIPAPSLSTAGNLTYDRALAVPGAEKRGNMVLLPPVTMADGRTASFEITPDSCARMVAGVGDE